MLKWCGCGGMWHVRACLQSTWQFAVALPAQHNSLKSSLFYHVLRHEADQVPLSPSLFAHPFPFSALIHDFVCGLCEGQVRYG
jgi:hypothetical protein